MIMNVELIYVFTINSIFIAVHKSWTSLAHDLRTYQRFCLSPLECTTLVMYCRFAINHICFFHYNNSSVYDPSGSNQDQTINNTKMEKWRETFNWKLISGQFLPHCHRVGGMQYYICWLYKSARLVLGFRLQHEHELTSFAKWTHSREKKDDYY